MRILLLIPALAVAASSPAQLVRNTFTDNNNNSLTWAMLDTGWQAKAFWNQSTGGVVHVAPGDNWGVGQVNSVSTEAGSVLNFSFDWTPGPTAAAGALRLEYQLIGWNEIGTPTNGNFFLGMNFNGKNVDTANGTLEKIDLVSGNSGGTSAGNFATSYNITGQAGVTTNVTIGLNLSDDASGLNDISQYEYIGFRFMIDSASDTNNVGGTVENVRFTMEEQPTSQPLASHDTGYTIMKVRSAQIATNHLIVGASYEGTIIGMDYEGTLLWTNELSGYMVHDMWCDDLTGNGSDEILVANADGSLYCLDGATGTNRWRFIPNDGGHLPPMYATCVVHSNGTPYAVCGAYDKYIYYVDSVGALVKSIYSGTYSISNTWGENAPPDHLHNATFLRPLHTNGIEKLAVHGSMNANQSNGELYLFDPLAELPYAIYNVGGPQIFGDLRIIDPDGDGNDEIIMGSSSLNTHQIMQLDTASGTAGHRILTGNLQDAGYRVTQTDIYTDGGTQKYFILCGATLLIGTPSGDSNIVSSTANYQCGYAFNDMWKDSATGKFLLASAQSGGSCIHIIDTQHPSWLTDYENLAPSGKIADIIANTANVWSNLASFSKPAWERDPIEVVLTSAGPNHSVAVDIRTNHDSPVFLNSYSDTHVQDPLDWDRNTALSNNPTYRDKRDGRRQYVWTQAQILADITPALGDGGTGLAMWGGHGNDPYYYSPDTLRSIIDLSGGEKTVLIWPEMNGSSEPFEMVMEHLFYPLADYARTNNATIMIRNKNIFWQGAAYLPAWSRLRSGEFSEVFTSALEETTDKTCELSVAGRMGMWASGALDSWGMRCSRDNPSFDRQRQFSYQRLPNHFLRNMVYNLAAGASFLNVSYIDVDYQSLAWKLVAEGALFVPKREEIVSFSPVHLGMAAPDEHYIKDGENNKWTTFYDQSFEQNNPFVFSRMNGTWPGAPNTAWDFSRYAAGVRDRRQNFIPPYPGGLVLITPPQEGIFADTNATRSAMTEYLHPMYRNILQEFVTDGRSYLSADGTTTNAADTYCTTVSNAIALGATRLPVTVSGNVGWVCAQTSPTHLRLTLVDGGYLNPKDQTITVTFNTVVPVSMTDVLDGKTYAVSNGTANVDVPLGLWRFLDIELSEPFFPDNGWGQHASELGLTGNPNADEDGDGESDFYEFGLGGNPTNPSVRAQTPHIQYGKDDIVSFFNWQVNATNPGISYIAEWTDNLVTGTWQGTWLSTTQSPASNPDYAQTERQMNGGTNDHLFFRLKMEQP